MQADSFKEFGKRIRAQRIKSNLTISDISGKTRISIKMLNILENGERDKFIAPVLIEGFLRNYMKAIGDNAEKWVRQLKALFLEEENQKIEYTKKTPATKIRKKNTIYIIIVLCVIILVYIFFTLPDLSKTYKSQTSQPAIKKLIPKPIIKGKQKIVPLTFTLRIKTAKEKSWFFYKMDNNKSRTGFINPDKEVKLKAKNMLIVTVGNSNGTQIFFNGNKIKIPNQVIHLKCLKSGCSLLSAHEWQNIIFQSSKNSSTSINNNVK